MPDDLDDDLELDDDTEAPAGAPAKLREALNRTKAEKQTLSSENATLKRENALLKAGLGGLNEKQQKALAAAHDGDFTPEALKQTAIDLGFAEPEPDTTATPDEQAEHRKVEATAAGAEQPNPDADYEAALEAAKTPDEALAVMHRFGKEVQT